MFPCTDFWGLFDESWDAGYFGPLFAVIFAGIGLVVSFIFTLIVSAYCLNISVILFFYGIIDIVRCWWRECFGDKNVDDVDYETIDDMVRRLNHYTNKKSKHFGVEQMVKMTTGLDVEDIWLRTKWSKFMQARTTGDIELLKSPLRFAVSSRSR